MTCVKIVNMYETHVAVDSNEWLWDWEKEDKNCFAQRAIKLDNRKEK